MRTAAAKKSFHPPFKERASCDIAVSGRAVRRQLYASQTDLANAGPFLESDSCAASPSTTLAMSAPSVAVNVFESLAAPKTMSDSNVDALPVGVTTGLIPPTAEIDVSLARCESPRRFQERIDARQAQLAGSKVLSLVADTLHWVTVSQEALQYLADARAAGQVVQVLSELHIDPLSVLFLMEEGRFSHP
ncbi:hypothetical protein JKF63_01343 [Porcisia hertigi]|uniref:Uncharacterized protein n=1 Tax=Porcisia hertigi TaxID=2761500 RepID=A0A836IE94_9TRYP|nr:hypothetical protein JKF63_01343 [Porcisia hertigi]